MSSWRSDPRLARLRGELREQHPRPRWRWSDLSVTCSMVGDLDRRSAVERLREVAERQTHARYGG